MAYIVMAYTRMADKALGLYSGGSYSSGLHRYDVYIHGLHGGYGLHSYGLCSARVRGTTWI